METIRKIDFFGGLHGNYLELVINHAIDQNPYDISTPQFNDNGACHKKIESNQYQPITVAGHFSYFNKTFDSSDQVIRIVPKQEDMLIAITNSFLRAGDKTFDLDNLETNTIEKLLYFPKAANFLKILIRDYGETKDYPRGVLRNYFYSMFDDPVNGIDMMTNWLPAQHYHNFAFESFFDINFFFESLQKIANFVNLRFLPTPALVNLHFEFLRLNQGYHSQLKCNKIIEAIITNQSMPLKLNIIEEAWVNYRISRTFNLYAVPELEANKYPADTRLMSAICFNEEKNC